MASKARHEDSEFGVWRSQTLTVEYSLQVLEELRMAAAEGYQKIPHGGIEMGALLLGEFDGGTARILEWRDLPCEHARGPGFVLTEADQDGIAILLEQCGTAPELEGLVPVGWFHTHTRSRLFLSDDDIAIHNRHFPESWQTAMVLSMSKDQPAQAVFFARETDGSLNGEAIISPFVVPANTAMMLRPRRGTAAQPKAIATPEPPPAAAPLRRERRSRVRPLGFEPHVEAYQPPPAYVPQTPQYPTTPPELLEEPPRRGFRWRLLGVMALVLVLVTAAVLTRPYWNRTDPETMALRVEEAQDQLVIQWDHKAAAVRHADRAVIQIVDGKEPRQIDLNGEDARLGTITYARRSEDVQVRLSLYQNGKVSLQESTRFLGPPVPAEGPVVVPPKTVEQLRDERDKLRVTLREEKARAQRLRESVRNLENIVRQEEHKSSGGKSAAQ